MARGNKRGPLEQGPMTGRGLGYCSGSEAPGYTEEQGRLGHGARQRSGPQKGRGFGPRHGRLPGHQVRRGRGRGFGSEGHYPNRPGWYEDDPVIQEQENIYDDLAKEIAELRSQLGALEDRLNNLGQ